MKQRTELLAVALLALVAWQANAQWVQQASGTTADFRGLSVVNEKIVWASGTKGSFTRTLDGGTTWQAGIVPGAEGLDFRDVEAFDANVAYLLSIGKGDSSRIYKTIDGGKTWKLQFRNSHPEAFFDAMAFWDAQHGISMSDPVDGRFLVITTRDGGATWNSMPSDRMPAALPNEGGFAASGTCIAVQGKNNVWIGTGGAAKARVFYSTDGGQSWSVSETPILAGVPSAGIFSVAFADAKNGVIVGGDYQKPALAEKNLAVTKDGGNTWNLIETEKPAGFRSGIVLLGKEKALAVGTSGSDYSPDGTRWEKLDHENYNAVAASRNGIVWAAGPKGRIAKWVVQ
jgi:photosystem II stability/assembly factor-like uncharacterized protein